MQCNPNFSLSTRCNTPGHGHSSEFFHAARIRSRDGSNAQPELWAWGETVYSLSSTIIAASLQALELSPKCCCQGASRSSAQSVRQAAGTTQIAHTNVMVVLPIATALLSVAAAPLGTNHEKKKKSPNKSQMRVKSKKQARKVLWVRGRWMHQATEG